MSCSEAGLEHGDVWDDVNNSNISSQETCRRSVKLLRAVGISR
jgi:hypothetical protein